MTFRPVASGAFAQIPTTIPDAGYLYVCTDTKRLLCSTGVFWFDVRNGNRIDPLTIPSPLTDTTKLYTPGAYDWLGTDVGIPSHWLSPDVEPSNGVVPNYFGMFSTAGGFDYTMLGDLPSGSDYHMIAHLTVSNNLSTFNFIRFGLSPDSVQDDGNWFQIGTGNGASNVVDGTNHDTGAPGSGYTLGSPMFVWVAIIGGVWKVRVSSDNATYHEIDSQATAIVPTKASIRVQTDTPNGGTSAWYNWIQISNTAPSGVTVI